MARETALLTGDASRRSSASAAWFSANPDKALAEKLYLTSIPVFFAYHANARIRPAERALRTTTP